LHGPTKTSVLRKVGIAGTNKAMVQPIDIQGNRLSNSNVVSKTAMVVR
jgi:hypothetical protein